MYILLSDMFIILHSDISTIFGLCYGIGIMVHKYSKGKCLENEFKSPKKNIQKIQAAGILKMLIILFQ